MKYPNPIIFLGVLALLFGAVYAANTIRVTVPETANDTSGSKSYANQELYVQSGALKLINLNNDDLLVGDYFTGFYHDSAYGPFEMEYRGVSGNSGDTQRVSISNTDVSSDCDNSITHIGYKLTGFSYSPEFGAMDFDHDSSHYAYICVPRLENSDLNSYLAGNAFSELIGTQHFGGIEFDAYVDRSIDHSSEARYVKIEGVTSSQNENTNNEDFENDVRVIGNVEKSSLRKNILQEVYTAILKAPINNGTRQVTSLGNAQWNNGSGGGTVLRNGTILYFGDLSGNQVRVSGSSDIVGKKTLVVEGGDIFIDNDILDTLNSSDMLGLIAVEKDGVGGNIIIDSDVTDIHAVMYADRSILSSVGGNIADGNTSDSSLANQLYINGSIFSENTTGGAVTSPYQCPFFVQASCDEALAKKYDLSFLRRYILVTEVDGDGNPTGNTSAGNGGQESKMGDGNDSNTESQAGKAEYRKYPLVIEYNSNIQTTPPPLFGN